MSGPRRAVRAIGWPARTVLLGLLAGYRRLASPALGSRCRFHPTCSAYAEEAIETRGAMLGLVLSLWRVARCSPLSRGGFDPVPSPHGGRSMNDPVIQKVA